MYPAITCVISLYTVVSVQFTDQTYVVEDDGMAEVSLIISTSIARSMNVTVIVSVLSTNGTEG